MSSEDRFPLLAPLVRIARRGNQVIVSNLGNGRWIRIHEDTLACLQEFTTDAIIRRLGQAGVDEADASNFVNTLIREQLLTVSGTDVPKELDLYPFNAYLNVTDFCNLTCTHCYFGSHPGLDHGASNADLIRVMDSLRDGGIRNLVIAGGEPLARPGIEELLQGAHDRFGELTLLTNGTILTASMLNAIVSYVQVVHVSLDGPTEKLNAVIRGPGHFEKIVENVRRLKTAGVKTLRLVTNINAANVHRMHEMRRLRDELGVELANNVFTEVGRGGQHRFLMPKSQDLIEFFLSEVTTVGCEVSGLGDRLNIQAGATCGSGTLMVSVDCRGDVFPCHLFHRMELKIGNLLEQPDLVVMLRESPVAAQMRSRTVDSRKCHGCDVENFCKGGCLAHTVAANETSPDPWKERDPFCEVHHAVLSAQLWQIVKD